MATLSDDCWKAIKLVNGDRNNRKFSLRNAYESMNSECGLWSVASVASSISQGGRVF